MILISIYWNDGLFFNSFNIEQAIDNIAFRVQGQATIEKCFLMYSDKTQQEVSQIKDILNNIFMLYKIVGVEVEAFEYAG